MAAGGLLASAAVVAPAANATDFVVDSPADNGDGSCQGVPVPGDGFCTLRDAINAANGHPNDPASTPDRITFADSVRGTIQLANSSLVIANNSLHIEGPGADKLTVAGPGSDRVFKLLGFGTPADNDYDVTMSGLTLSGGDSSGAGGAIANFGADCATATAALTLEAMTIDDNSAADVGGAIAVDPPGGCSPTRDKAGGTPSAEQGALNISDSTISNNDAGDMGGGIALSGYAGPLFVSNSTIVANESGDVGGGISVIVPSVAPKRDGKIVAGPFNHVDNSTVTGNTSVNFGGGIYTEADLGLRSTIVQGNHADEAVTTKATVDADLATDSATISAGYSDIGTRDGATVTDVPGEANISADPQLSALADNGGPTPTVLPEPTSPVIDAGIANSLTADQRGEARPADRIPDDVADGTDIGAVELPAEQKPVEPTPITTTPEEPTTTTPEQPVVPGPSTQDCAGQQVILTKGTDADETLTGTGVDDGIVGAGGVDTIAGLGGNDCLFGQIGNDLVIGGPGDDNVNGDRDEDVVKGGAGADSVRGQNGDDKVSGGAGDDPVVTGGAGDDKVSGGSGDDFLKGDGGNDVIDPGAGKDVIHAGGGADEIDAADGEKDKIICGTGKDVAHVDPIDKRRQGLQHGRRGRLTSPTYSGDGRRADAR